MISRFFITCLVLCFSAIYTLKAQELVANFPFDDPADPLNNAVDDDPDKDGILIEGDGTAVCEDLVSGEKGLCNTAGSNFDMRIPTELFEGHDNIRIEIEFLNQEQFSQPITTNRGGRDPEAAPSGFTSFRIFHGNPPEDPGDPDLGFGFNVVYSTTDNPLAAIESEFIPNGVALNERATITFGYNQTTGIARLFKNDVEIWRTPEEQETPGAAFSIGSTNQTADGVRYVLLGNGMNGEGSAVPSLLGFRVYDNDCPILPLPVLESTPEELTVCGSGTTTLTVSGALDEAEYLWYDANGEEIPGETGNTFTTPELTQTTTYSVAISDNPCLGDPLEIQVVVQPIPEAPEVVTPAPVCEPSVFTLEATGGTDGNYQWYSEDQDLNLVPIPGANQATYTTAELTVPTQFFVSITDGACESELTPLPVTIVIPPEAPTADPVVVCQPGEVTLQVNDADEFTYRWYDQPTGGTLLAENDGAFTTTIDATTTFYVSAQSGGCESERVPLEVSLAERPAAPQSEDQAICEAGPVTLTATGSTDGNYRWYEGDNPTPIAGAVNSTFSSTVAQTTTYYVAVDDGICQSDPTPVTVTILSEAAPPRVDGPQNCTPTAFELVVNNAVAGSTYRWYAADGTTVLSEGPARYTTDVLSEPTDYLVAQVVGDCEGAPTLVRATVYPPVPPPTINPTLLCEPGEAVLQVNAPDDNMLYRWYRSPDNQMSTGMLAENGGTLRLDVSDNTTFYVSAWNGTCESERTPVTVGVLEAPTIDAGDDTRVLPGDRVTLTAPAGFVQYQWSPSEGLDNPNIRQPTATPTRTTTYYLTVTTDQDCDLTSTVTVAVAERLPIPNAFTPNADGLNDTWDIPFLRRYPQSQVLVYNRWGSLIFQSEPGYEKAWDGFYQGSVVQQGTYTYVLDLGNGQKPTRGHLTILQ